MKNTTLFIYYTPDRSVFQVIRPTQAFFNEFKNPEQEGRGWRSLVEGVTNSNHKHGIKNYHSWEIK